MRLQPSDARITIVKAQPSGFGERGVGAFDLVFERIGGGEKGVHERGLWIDATRPFQPEYRLIGA